MIFEEALWIGEKLCAIAKSNVVNVLNAGSSTLEYRTNLQPYYNTEIIIPAESSGIKFTHLDYKKDIGVDIVGDLCSEELMNLLAKHPYDAVVCTNVISHVPDPSKTFDTIKAATKEGGYILFTCLDTYPYVNDPIDNGFRADTDRLFNTYFSDYKLIDKKTITLEKTMLQSISSNPKYLAIRLIRLFIPFYKYSSWKIQLKDIPILFNKIKVSCLLVQKQ